MPDLNKTWDMAILGGGPAGLTAAIYGARAGHSVILIEKMLFGGEIVSSARLDNYPGFPEGLTGAEFGERLEKQAERFGVELTMALLQEARLFENPKQIVTSAGKVTARKVIIATGTVPRKLGVPGEDKLLGKGVSHCATCDGAFFRDQEVAVAGGGDAAAEEALFLTRFARKIYIIHRRDRLRAVKVLQDKLLSHPAVEILWDSRILSIKGDQKVEGLELAQKENDRYLPVDGLFIYIGRDPKTDLFKDEIELDENGFILTDEEMRTSCPGVFAAGDVRFKLLRQVVTAAADGAVAAYMAARELQYI